MLPAARRSSDPGALTRRGRSSAASVMSCSRCPSSSSIASASAANLGSLTEQFSHFEDAPPKRRGCVLERHQIEVVLGDDFLEGAKRLEVPLTRKPLDGKVHIRPR